MKYLKYYENINEGFKVGDEVLVNSELIKNKNGKIVGFYNNKTAEVDVDGVKKRVSINNLHKKANKLDPFDEEDWDEEDIKKSDEVVYFGGDYIGRYQYDNTIGVFFEKIRENARYYFGQVINYDDITLDGDKIFFYLNGGLLGEFEPRTLLDFRDEFIYNSRFVDTVIFLWSGKIEIILNGDYEYEH